MAIFITGDTHGDFSRLLPAAFHEQRDLTKEDYLILCGDFGGVWDGGDAEQQWLDWLETRSFTTLFVSGNHENYDLLRNYPISQWHGGLVQAIRPSVLHLMRGQLYNICGKRIFTMGGASSHDIRDDILEPDNLYLLDEPEVSLSPQNQVKLAEEINQCARFLGCQFIIATHSPFMLGTLQAKIYNLESTEVEEAKWYELKNVRYFYEFFDKNRKYFVR